MSYTLSKAALEAATTMLALALAPAVRVVGVAPGLTLTSTLLTDAQFQERHKLALLDQSSTPADVAATVRFALENRSITGTSLLVDAYFAGYFFGFVGWHGKYDEGEYRVLWLFLMMFLEVLFLVKYSNLE